MLLNNFEKRRTNGAKKPVELGKRKIMKERGELSNEESDVVREHEATFGAAGKGKMREVKKKE